MGQSDRVGIPQSGSDIVINDIMQLQIVIELPQCPHLGFFDMDRGTVMSGCEIDIIGGGFLLTKTLNVFSRIDKNCKDLIEKLTTLQYSKNVVMWG